jgi:2-dehydropantoate 2-reductase
VTRFTILGAGGIGTAVGVMLQAAGHPVTLVTRHEADAEHIDVHGARVVGSVELDARPTAVAGAMELSRDDVLVLAVKAHQTWEALAAVSGIPRAALSVQNGIEKELPLIERFGRERVLASVVQVTATLEAPGRSRCASVATSAVSPLDLSGAELARKVVEAFDGSGMPTQLVPDAAAVEWAKAAQWIPSSLLSAATGLSMDAVVRDERLAHAFVTITRECAEVARRHGSEIAQFPELYARELVDGSVEDAVRTLIGIGEEMRGSGLAGYRTAMELDLARGKAPELEPTAGAVERAAQAVGVPCPALETAHAVVRARAGRTLPVQEASCA